MRRINTCSQKTITSASKRLFSGMRQALRAPKRRAERDRQGPYLTLLAGRFVMPKGCIVRAAARQRPDNLNPEPRND